MLRACDVDVQLHVKRTYEIGEIIDDCSLRLELWPDERRSVVPASLSASLAHGTLSCEYCSVTLAEGPKTGIAMGASLVSRPRRSKDSCLREWRAALQARLIDVPQKPQGMPKGVPPAQPDAQLLHVGVWMEPVQWCFPPQQLFGV